MPITIAMPKPRNSIVFYFYSSGVNAGLKISTTLPMRIAYVGYTMPEASEQIKPSITTKRSRGVEYL